MKKLLIGLLLLTSVSSFAAKQWVCEIELDYNQKTVTGEQQYKLLRYQVDGDFDIKSAVQENLSTVVGSYVDMTTSLNNLVDLGKCSVTKL